MTGGHRQKGQLFSCRLMATSAEVDYILPSHEDNIPYSIITAFVARQEKYVLYNSRKKRKPKSKNYDSNN